MKEKIQALSNELASKLMAGFKRFPVALSLALLVVAVLIYCNHDSNVKDSVYHIVQVLALGIPLALCIRICAEKGIKRVNTYIAYMLSALALVLYYHFLLPDMGMVAVSRYIALTLAGYLLFIFLAYPASKEYFELYVIKLATNFIISYFYSLILFLGLIAIVFTINSLFSAGISDKFYLDVWLIVAGIFAPAYFLAGIPAGDTIYELDEYPRFIQVLLLYIVMPLLSVYTAILYAYFIKILVTRHWPSGMISNLVLWYAFISVAVVFFIYLLKEKNAWVQAFLNLFPKLILPLLAMMFVAMSIRINAYGVTENRYLVLVGGIWVTGCMLYFALKREHKNRMIVLSAAIIAVLIVCGPWSCYSISQYSQNARLAEILAKNKMLVNGEIIPSPNIPQKDKIAISSIVNYFQNSHQTSDIDHVPPDFQMSDMTKVFGFEYMIDAGITGFNHSLEQNGEFQDIRGYDYYMTLPNDKSGKAVPGEEINADKLKADYDQASCELRVTKAGRVIYKKNIRQVALNIHENNAGSDYLSNDQMSFIDDNDRIKIKILFQDISGGREYGGSEATVNWMRFLIFIKEK